MGDATKRLIEFWRNFKSGTHWIHSCDEKILSLPRYRNRVCWDVPANQAVVIDEIRRKRSRLQSSIIPQPFVGDLCRADIILGLLNPGLDPGDWLSEREGTETRTLKLAGLRQEPVRLPFWCIDPEIAHTGAFRWWWPRFAKLAESFVEDGWTFNEAMEKLSQRVVCVEIVPYHSRSAGLISNDLIAQLESSKHAINYVRERAEEGAQIILLRSHGSWGLTDDTDRVRLVTNSHRSINLGPDTLAGRIIRSRMNSDR